MQKNRNRAAYQLFAALLAMIGPLGAMPARADETIRIGGTGAALGLVRQLGAAFEHQQRDSRVVVEPSTGSRGGIKAVDKGALDVAISSRELRRDEQARGLIAREFARTPFVLAAAGVRSGTVLRLDEVASIYRGDITHWPNGDRIRIVLRPRADTDTMIIRSLSPAMDAALDEALARRGMLVAITDQENADLLMKVPGGLGFTSLTQIVTERLPLTALSVGGVLPTTATGVNTAYPYFKQLYYVVHRQSSPAVVRFLSFLRSPRAQRIITAAGALPLSMEQTP